MTQEGLETIMLYHRMGTCFSILRLASLLTHIYSYCQQLIEIEKGISTV